MALDKCPGVRPIGVGETLRRIAGKSVCMLTKGDLEDACGTSQLCGGIHSGIEGAIHTLRDLFNEHQEEGWGILLIDASNAFNCINHHAALWNSRILCPSSCLTPIEVGLLSPSWTLVSCYIAERESLKATLCQCSFTL